MICSFRPITVTIALLLVACSGTTDGSGTSSPNNGVQPDSAVPDATDSQDSGEAQTEDAAPVPPMDGAGPFDLADGAVGGGQPPSSPDGSLSNGAPDEGLDGPGSGRGEGGTDGNSLGGGECVGGFGGDALLTNAQGMADGVLDVIMEASEDGPGYFSLGVHLSQWSPDITVDLNVLNGGVTIAEGRFNPQDVNCGPDSTWQIDDLRMNALPSIEIDDIIELELEVTGEIRNGSEGDQIIVIAGTIRLQY